MTARRSGVSSLLPPNDDIPLSFSMISKSGSESIKYLAKKTKFDGKTDWIKCWLLIFELENPWQFHRQCEKSLKSKCVCVSVCKKLLLSLDFPYFFFIFDTLFSLLTLTGRIAWNVISHTSLLHNITMRTFSTFYDVEHVSGVLRCPHSVIADTNVFFFLFLSFPLSSHFFPFSAGHVCVCSLSTFYRLVHEFYHRTHRCTPFLCGSLTYYSILIAFIVRFVIEIIRIGCF